MVLLNNKLNNNCFTMVLLRAHRKTVVLQWFWLTSDEKERCCNGLLRIQRTNTGFTCCCLLLNETTIVLSCFCVGVQRTSIGFTLVMLMVKRKCVGFTKVLFSVQRKTRFYIGVAQDEMKKHWFAFVFTMVLVKVQRTKIGFTLVLLSV